MLTPEGKVKRKVTALLSQYGAQIYRFMPVQGGYGAATLDYLGCAAGRFFAIETKAPGAKPTERQIHCAADIVGAGGTVFFIIGDDGLDALKAWLDATIGTSDNS